MRSTAAKMEKEMMRRIYLRGTMPTWSRAGYAHRRGTEKGEGKEARGRKEEKEDEKTLKLLELNSNVPIRDGYHHDRWLCARFKIGDWPLLTGGSSLRGCGWSLCL
jgi:hypothetical protein